MKLLILDLDETLIHGLKEPLSHDPDCIIDNQFYIYLRPHLARFIEYAFLHFQVAIWTSASATYAAAVTDVIIPSKFKLEFLWSNERCTKRKSLETWDEYWVKNLRKVKRLGYDLDAILMVDDTPQKLSENYGNYIRISPYEGDRTDDELIYLQRYLSTLLDVDNVRKIEKRSWKELQKNRGMK